MQRFTAVFTTNRHWNRQNNTSSYSKLCQVSYTSTVTVHPIAVHMAQLMLELLATGRCRRFRITQYIAREYRHGSVRLSVAKHVTTRRYPVNNYIACALIWFTQWISWNDSKQQLPNNYTHVHRNVDWLPKNESCRCVPVPRNRQFEPQPRELL